MQADVQVAVVGVLEGSGAAPVKDVEGVQPAGQGVDDALVRKGLLEKFGIEIGAGLGAFKGKVWRIGLMGYGSRESNVLLFLSALEQLLAEVALSIPDDNSLAGLLPQIKGARVAVQPAGPGAGRTDGVLLGLDPDAEYEEATLQMRGGDTLLLFTDGLIERRAGSISDALRDLTDAAIPPALGPPAPGPPGEGISAAAAPPPDPSPADVSATADRILGSAISDTGDDACLVAVRIL